MRKVTFLILFFSLAGLQADIIETKDGARLIGTIESISDGKIHLSTSYAGKIVLDQSEVVGIQRETPITVRLDSGTTVTGPLAGATGSLSVQGAEGSVTTAPGAIAAAWAPGQTDPAILANQRKWAFTAGVNIAGKIGNTEKQDIGLSFDAKLESPQDILRFYASYDYGEADGVTTDEEYKVGGSYDSFFYEDLGWYVRTELEKDEFENIDLRLGSGAGLSYRILNQEKLKLTGRFGASYRYEDYTTDTSEEFPGLDFGLRLRWQFAEWGRLTTDLGYTPSVEDFADFLLVHDSAVEMPLGTSTRWALRLGVANEYNSTPDGDRDELDTSYYARLILNWD